MQRWHLWVLPPTCVLYYRTLTLAVMLSGLYPAASVYSLFSCWACAPTRLLKLVVRWRLSRVFWGGMFSSMASVSELNRGSSIYVKRGMLRCFVQRFSFFLSHKLWHYVHSQRALHAHHCPSGLAHTLPGPQTSATPSLCGWTTGPPHWGWTGSKHTNTGKHTEL